MNRKRNVLFIAVLLLGVFTLGLGMVTAQDDEGPMRFFIVSHGGPGNPFWNVAIQGMNDACAALDVIEPRGVECQWLGDETFGFDNMPGYMDDALAAGASGIGITAARPEAVEEGANEALSQGIPVIALNAPDTRETPIPYLFYIGGDEYLGGRAVADAMLATGTDISRAVCPIQEPGHTGLEARCQGFRDVMEEAGVTVENLATDNDVSITSGILSDYYLAHPDLNAVFSLGPLPSDAYYQFLDENGVDPATILHGTFDLSPAIISAIQDGRTLIAIDQQQYLQGYETIQWLYLNAKYGLTPANDILTGPGSVTADNVDLVASLAGTYR
jgi:simple sugar transport system substrate-binding protein